MNRQEECLDIGEPKDIDESKLKELSKFLMDAQKVPALKFFIVGKKTWLRMYKTTISCGSHTDRKSVV